MALQPICCQANRFELVVKITRARFVRSVPSLTRSIRLSVVHGSGEKFDADDLHKLWIVITTECFNAILYFPQSQSKQQANHLPIKLFR